MGDVPEGTCAHCGNPWSLTHSCYPRAAEAAPTFQPHTPWELGVKREINALQDAVRALEDGRADGEPLFIKEAYLLKRAEAAERDLSDARSAYETEKNARKAAERDNAQLAERIARAEGERDEAVEERDHLREFKVLVHSRLDDAGIGEMPDARCRVGARLGALRSGRDIARRQREEMRAERDAAHEALRKIAEPTITAGDWATMRHIAQQALDGDAP